MSDSHRMPGLIGSKRAASPANAAAEAPMQRQRLSSSIVVAADPPSTVHLPLSAAQRCADDALAIVFGFIEFRDLYCATRTCRAWLATAAKEKPRRQCLTFKRADRLAALCASSSPLKKHISSVISLHFPPLALKRLTALRQLAQLTSLEVRLSADELIRLLNKDGGGSGAAAALKAAFPPKLRQLRLVLSESHSTAVRQLLLDALPAMEGLEALALTVAAKPERDDDSAPLSLRPLLQLPRLTHLQWDVGELTLQQLRTIKQIATLQHFNPGEFEWTTEQLAAFRRPPHRLQKLETFELWETTVDEAAMAELVCLPALTALQLIDFTSGVYAFLPRLPRLQQLSVFLDKGDDAEQQAADKALLVSALSACPALTDLTLMSGDCSESFGDRLMQAVPRLRTLYFYSCSLPSMRFMRHAPQLAELTLSSCKVVRPGHVVGIGSLTPQLESLCVKHCAGLRLDDDEVRLLTPPGAFGLPRLCWFKYVAPVTEDSGGSDSDGEPDLLSPQ